MIPKCLCFEENFFYYDVIVTLQVIWDTLEYAEPQSGEKKNIKQNGR